MTDKLTRLKKQVERSEEILQEVLNNLYEFRTVDDGLGGKRVILVKIPYLSQEE